MTFRIVRGGLDDSRVQALLTHHVETARAETARGCAHALEVAGLKSVDIAFWSAWDDERVVGVGALKRLSPTHGEIKSMHTLETCRRSGIGTAMLRHIMDAAREMGIRRISLETGSWSYFEAARALYRKHGFVECGPFGAYTATPNSVFMTLALDEAERA